MSSKKLHHIIFCEPQSYDGSTGWKDLIFAVNDEMYQLILNGPTESLEHNGDSTAYIFGPRFPLKEYRFAFGHGNDVAATGFIDADLVGGWTEDAERNNKLLKLERDDREALLEFRKTYPFLIWLGETYGGDVGVDLFVHRNEQEEIDGIMVDNNYFTKT